MPRTRRPLARVPLLAIAIASALIASVAPAAPTSRKQDQRAVESSVVKIFVHSNPPDPFSPWQKSGTETVTGSGVVIDGRRILTAAHVVEYAVNIEVKRTGMSDRFVAEVSFTGPECDLALLTVADERFFADTVPLDLGEAPVAQDEVQAYGFPIGGETISVTSGIVSRVEIGTYAHSWENLLIAQIDAPINAGNSGGPVVSDGALVGIALQTLEDGENVGYMTPAPIIRHLLDDVSDGRYDGFPRLGVEFQELESASQRTFLGMGDGQTGALVARVDHGGPADSFLKPGDVLLEIDGHTVANDGTVARPRLGRIRLEDVFEEKQIGDTLPLSILRDGKPLLGEVRLTPHRFLVPGRPANDLPQYLVFAGLVFQPLTIAYLRNFEDPPVDLVNHALVHNIAPPDRNQVIVIQKVLPHPVNRGYREIEDYVVATVNGVVPRDMADLARMIDEATGRWLEIVTEDEFHLVLDLAEARAARESILSNFGIARDRSPDLE